MYGFENTNIEDLKKDIDFILELNPSHISTYSLEIHDNTKFAIDKVCVMDEELDRMMYDYIHKRLTENNYIHYEISNYSKEGFESKHNLCYWNNKCYYGFGVGASSYINNERITNSRSITSYINNNIKREIETLNTKDKIVYELILGLRLKDGINLSKFKEKYNKEINEIYNLSSLIKENKIIINNDFIKVPFDKWYTINSILIDFLEVNYE
jgi:oxygen-independent coproporphyrinogen-3 oxidase